MLARVLVKHKNDIFLLFETLRERVLCVFVVQKYFLTAKARSRSVSPWEKNTKVKYRKLVYIHLFFIAYSLTQLLTLLKLSTRTLLLL